ncbi:phage holin family protein [Limosilactobacillus balticus]|uniref:Phage holin family protein n=2 Tax=Limosilactobacillus balticus TaxID=2759747 RepID=A0ABS8RGN8_9LACO|nr:phage holin family protein [Limosilactobacillus balticus]MCD7139411.1 phage holin family protein [Limosilactobacillus balticus]
MQTRIGRQLACLFLFYLVSIIENWGQMGLPLPAWIKDHIYKLIQ